MKNSDLTSLRSAIILSTLMVTSLLHPNFVSAQTFSPYADFQAMTLQQLATLQVKLTYVGSRREPSSSVAFTSSANKLDLNQFVPFRRPGIDYSNDGLAPVLTFAASTNELQAVIADVGKLPNVTAGAVAANVFLSFALFNSQPSAKGFEAVLNKADTTALFNQLRLSLANNKDALRILSEMACPLELLEVARPMDVSASVKVSVTGLRLQRTTGRFLGTAKVANNSAGALAAPVSLVFVPTANVRLVNGDGTTCGTTPIGLPFINLPGALAAGQSAEINVEFENPDRLQFSATTKVLAGPGAR
jgi:hypothetical protein